MQSSVMIDRNGAGISVAYIRSMMWLPAIFTSMKCCSCRRNASRNCSNDSRVAGLRPDLPLCARIVPVVQRDLDHLRQVEVAREDVAFLAERAHLDTAAG